MMMMMTMMVKVMVKVILSAQVKLIPHLLSDAHVTARSSCVCRYIYNFIYRIPRIYAATVASIC